MSAYLNASSDHTQVLHHLNILISFLLLICFLIVLIYDHRGIGNSSLSLTGDEEISIERLARDLLALLVHLNWKEVDRKSVV